MPPASLPRDPLSFLVVISVFYRALVADDGVQRSDLVGLLDHVHGRRQGRAHLERNELLSGRRNEKKA